jgi:hypothetical protein
MKTLRSIPLLATLAVPCLIAAVSIQLFAIDFCKRTEGVSVKDIGAELTKVTNRCWVTPPCNGNSSACASTYAHPKPLWSGSNEAKFSIAEQNTILAAASQAAAAHVEMCGTKRKVANAYQFKTVAVGTGPHTNLAIMVTITYGICDNTPPKPVPH